MSVKVIIPAFNEGEAIGKVIKSIPDIVQEIIVVNNNSTDDTKKASEKAGATALDETRRGYGYACLKGIAYLQSDPPDVVVFIDGDYSDHAEQLPLLLKPIGDGSVDFVVGSRSNREKGSMTTAQIFGNALACYLMKVFFKSTFTDLGPFRAIRYHTLMALDMTDKTYGWTVEMQLKVLKMGVKYTEVPVSYRNRIGVSKVSGTVKGTMMAGYKILFWIFKYGLKK